MDYDHRVIESLLYFASEGLQSTLSSDHAPVDRLYENPDNFVLGMYCLDLQSSFGMEIINGYYIISEYLLNLFRRGRK